MDIPMPMMNGLETARREKAQFPHVRVVTISIYTNEEYVLRALRVGAEAYLANDVGGSELENAILSVVRGETYVSPAVSRVLVNYVRRTARELQPIERLTRRQREVLQLIAEGKTTREIAQILGISVKTVERIGAG
jgi:DNA-binding NarL/FixJ family response regulator